jgi:hypothetical protein
MERRPWAPGEREQFRRGPKDDRTGITHLVFKHGPTKAMSINPA